MITSNFCTDRIINFIFNFNLNITLPFYLNRLISVHLFHLAAPIIEIKIHQILAKILKLIIFIHFHLVLSFIAINTTKFKLVLIDNKRK